MQMSKFLATSLTDTLSRHPYFKKRRTPEEKVMFVQEFTKWLNKYTEEYEPSLSTNQKTGGF